MERPFRRNRILVMANLYIYIYIGYDKRKNRYIEFRKNRYIKKKMKLYFSNSTDELPLTPNHLLLLRTEIRVTLSRPTCIDNSTATLLVHILRFTD